MVRPRKCRHIRVTPASRFYKPQGMPLRGLRIVTIKDEELEALSLADAQGLDQESAAALMNISRSTFSRILATARKSVATALINGAALKIEGGDYHHIADTEERDGGAEENS
ncbi:MAG: DUF134 domain-containing protein [Alphaproteobacteria bacterium]